jgi:uncharacterized protein (TIRG00374 family)
VAFGALIPIVCFANTVNGLTPASAGEVLRAVLLHRRHDVPYRDGAAVILLERVYALGLIAATALTCFAALVVGPLAGVSLIILTVVAIGIPTIGYKRGLRFEFAIRKVARAALDRSVRARNLVQSFGEVEDRVAAILSSWRYTLAFIALTGIVFVTMDAQLWLVGQSIGVAIDPVAGWAALGLGAIAGVLSALPFGLGAADAVIAIVLIGQGMDPAAAGLATILMRIVGTLPTGIVGAASYVYLNRTDGAREGSGARPIEDGTPETQAR